MTGLRVIGSICSASAFDSFLGYFEHLCLELGEPDLAARVRKLAVFYHKLIWVLCISFVLRVTGKLPQFVLDVVVPVALLGCGVALLIFFIRFGSIIRSIRSLARFRWQYETQG